MIKSISTPKGVIIVREANLADVDQYRLLRLFALQESPLAFGQDHETSLNYSPETWQERLREGEHSVTFIAEHEQSLIGMTGILRRLLPKTKHSATIVGVYLHPEWRGLRIANSLIDACIEWAKLKGVVIVKLSVNAENTSAIRCYQRCGFTIYGTEPRGIFYNGRYYDGHLMFKALDNSQP
jgi:RimJ/RimL family protein N-acetyltransferase